VGAASGNWFPDESWEMRVESGYLLWPSTADTMYQILRNCSSVSYTIRSTFGIKRAEFSGASAGGPFGNDIMVSIPSALGTRSLAPRVTNSATFSGPAGPVGARNHASVADANCVSTVAPWLKAAEQALGDLK